VDLVMLEVKYLHSRKRISISFEEVLEKTETSENVVIHPLDIFVATFAPVKLEIHYAIIGPLNPILAFSEIDFLLENHYDSLK